MFPACKKRCGDASYLAFVLRLNNSEPIIQVDSHLQGSGGTFLLFHVVLQSCNWRWCSPNCEFPCHTLTNHKTLRATQTLGSQLVWAVNNQGQISPSSFSVEKTGPLFTTSRDVFTFWRAWPGPEGPDLEMQVMEWQRTEGFVQGRTNFIVFHSKVLI